MEPTGALREKEIEFSLANDLPEQFGRLSQELDKKKVSPVSEVHQYAFTQTAILYSYPPEVRALLDVYQSDVEKVAVTTHEGTAKAPIFSIRIYTDQAGILEIAPPTDQQSDAAYLLNQVGQETSVTWPLAADDVGNLLVSLALSPDDCAEIDRARASQAAITPLNPRDPSVFHLLKNSLDTYADEFSTVQRYKLSHVTPYEDTPLDIDFFVTKHSDGSECYDVTLESSYVEPGYASAFTISARCFSGKNCHNNEMTIQGTRRVIAGEDTVHESIGRTSATAFVGATLDTLANSVLAPTKQARL